MSTYSDDPKLAEITRLNHELTNLWALTDDAAKAAETLFTEGDESELDAWLARYREARHPS